MDHVMVELKFLYTYLGYAHIWSNKSPSPSASASASAPSPNDELKLVTEAKELIVFLKTNFIDRFTTNDDIDIDPPPQPQPQDDSSISATKSKP